MKFLASILLLGLLLTATFSQTTKPKPAAKKPGTKTATALTKPKATASALKKPVEKDEWEKASAITDSTARISALRKFVATFPKSTHIVEAYVLISTDEAALGNEKLVGGDPEAAVKFIRSAAKDAPKPIPDQLFTDTLSKYPANLYFRGLRDEGFEIAKIIESKGDANTGQLLNIAGFYLSVENGSEARRVAENVIKLDPNSSAAYQTLGLANRVDFKLDESAAAYAKALELEPESMTARRGLAEMKRSLGKSDEAVALYREILANDDANVPARTGLILALFDADKRADAEAEMAKSLEANPGNIMLLAGAAYWYAAHNDGALAVTFAQKAIDADPRFIWSHIALARGLLSQNKPADAERELLAARQYGNFPTLEYEIASARLAAGLYREAAEGLLKSFSVKDGSIHTDLGGRVSADAKTFTDLIAAERKASLFTPMAADSAENAAQLRSLLEFEEELQSAQPRSEAVSSAIDDFVRGDDKMKIHRQIFAASELLEKKVAVPKILELTQAAPSALEAGLDVADPSTAVMASELYENRAIAASRGQYIYVPLVPRTTLSAILRGRIEEISGWASFQTDDTANAVLHLKRAVGVLPADSAWWRSSTWRLGNALAASGNNDEALEAYIKSYKSAGPDALRYTTIESLYKRVKGNTLGLEDRIGPNPAAPPPSEAVAQKIEPTPEAKTDVSSAVPIKPETTPEARTYLPPSVPVKPESSPEAKTDVPSSVPIKAGSTPTSDTTARAEPTIQAAAQAIEAPPATPATTTETATPFSSPSPTLESTKETATVETSPAPTLESAPRVQKSAENKPSQTITENKPASTPKELFPPVIITIPAAETAIKVNKPQATAEPSPTAVDNKSQDETKPASSVTQEPNPTNDTVAEKQPAGTPEPTPQPTVLIAPCAITVSDENIRLDNSKGVEAVIVGTEGDDKDLEDLKANSTSSENLSVTREVIGGMKTRALFVVRSISAKTGVYQITFELPCGKKDVTVKVQ